MILLALVLVPASTAQSGTSEDYQAPTQRRYALHFVPTLSSNAELRRRARRQPRSM